MRQCNFDNQHQRMHERGILMPVTTLLQKKDDSMKGVIFIILGAVIVMGLALATGYFQP